MHLIALNVVDMILSLWHATIECHAPDTKSSWDWAVLQGNVWKAHGKVVTDATPYLPGSFDRPPHNPAEKITSGYKAWEFLAYIFRLGPGLLYQILPKKYWPHFCKLIMAVHILHQCQIHADQLVHAHSILIEFICDYEVLYYQQNPSRIHFCRPSLHALLHLATEVIRLGPLVYYTQWTMEHTIGNLGKEIKQPSKPYVNLSQCGMRCSQVNALKTMIPNLDPKPGLPRGAIDLATINKHRYVLLRAKDENVQTINGAQAIAIHSYMEGISGNIAVGWNPCAVWWV